MLCLPPLVRLEPTNLAIFRSVMPCNWPCRTVDLTSTSSAKAEKFGSASLPGGIADKLAENNYIVTCPRNFPIAGRPRGLH